MDEGATVIGMKSSCSAAASAGHSARARRTSFASTNSLSSPPATATRHSGMVSDSSAAPTGTTTAPASQARRVRRRAFFFLPLPFFGFFVPALQLEVGPACHSIATSNMARAARRRRRLVVPERVAGSSLS